MTFAALPPFTEKIIPQAQAEEVQAAQEASPDTDFIFDANYKIINGYVGAGGHVIIPEAIWGIPVTMINECAFGWQKGITEVTVPDSVIVIKESAFYNCTNLVRVNLGNTVNTLYRRPFLNCPSLEEITVGEGNPAFKSVDGVLYSYDMKTLLWYPPAKKDTEFKIPDGVEEIDEFAFSGAKNLVKVTMPDSLVKIDQSAFMWCENITEIEFGDGLQEIGELAFSGCSSLKEAKITSPLVSVGGWAFDDCPSLEKLYLPKSISYIGEFILFNSPNCTVVCFGDSYAAGYANSWGLPYAYAGTEVFGFYDIKGHWAEEEIEKLIDAGLVNGYTDGTFRPDNTIKRSEFVKLMTCATSGEKAPTSNEWYSGYFSYLYNRVNIGMKSFSVLWEEPITRSEMALVISKLLQHDEKTELSEATEKSEAFTDYDTFTEEIIDAVEKDIITGYEDGSFSGDKNATRAEAVTMVSRAMKYCS